MLQEQAVKLLLALGKVHCKADCHATALPYLLSAQLQARQLALHTLEADAAVQLTEVTIALDSYLRDKIITDLSALLPAIVAQGSLALQAQAHMAMGHHLLIDMTPEQLEADHVRPLDHFRAATQLFQELEDWKLAAEAQYLVAMVCDTAHLQSQRNLSAAGCLHLQSLAAAA